MDRFRDEAQAHDIDALGNYRDALLSGAAPEELERLAAGLDPALLRLVQRMHSVSVHHWPQPEPTFARELERQLRQELIGRRVQTLPIPGASANGHVPGPLPQPLAQSHPVVNRARTRSWSRYLSAMAAVLALALIGSLIIMRFVPPNQGATRNVLNAAHQPTVDTLFDGTVENPAESWTPLAVERWTFKPGQSALSIPPLKGPQWIVAEGGGLVLGINGKDRELPVGAGVAIAAGQELRLRNAGPRTVSALRGFAEASYALADHDRAFITGQPALDTEADEALPPGASRVVFERLTLLAGATLQLEPATGQDWLAVTSGRLGLTLLGDGLPPYWRSGREREVTADELLPTLVPGTRVTLRNIGEEPLVVLRLRVLPAQVSRAVDAQSPG